ncbi:MAG: DUF2182 domain-containing protein, partial [Leptolyngbyaceae cyanobacterium CAN_BIN12]|nr:DUF2182 domain-containing protein [Leptolyngbyaceae cyanobacterium CAN_BIN12]
FVLGWLLPWALFGFAADLALFAGSVNSQLSHFQPINVIAMTLIAGLYQFTPLKLGFLKHHQSPCFTSSRQGVGIQAAFSMGLQHGFCCVGSCWGLMLVMLAFGAMTRVLMGLATITILVERSVPWQSPMRHMLGLSLLALAIWTAVQAVGI